MGSWHFLQENKMRQLPCGGIASGKTLSQFSAKWSDK
jgi:hypothetical protein